MRALIRKAVTGNLRALRLCVERLVPPTRERALPIDIPAASSAVEITLALQAIFRALGDGQLTPGEAHKLAAILENQRRAIETAELEERITALEEGSRSNHGKHYDNCNQSPPSRG